MSDATPERSCNQRRREKRSYWETRQRAGAAPGEPEPSVVEMLELLPRGGLALDVAAGTGRHSLLLARAGFKVVAIDYAEPALRTLQSIARAEKLLGMAAGRGPFDISSAARRFDAILNLNFLDRALIPHLIECLAARRRAAL